MRQIIGTFSLVLFLAAGLFSQTSAQVFKFRQYGIEDGICHPFVYSINQDKNGYLWLCTGEGLCRFDGEGFTGDFTSDSLPDAFVKSTYRDKAGNLWFGHNDGNMTYYDGRKFTIIIPDEKITSTINDIVEDPAGNILFVTQNQGIIKVTPELESTIIQKSFNRKLLSAVCFTDQNKMLLGAYDGLHLYEYDSEQDTAFPITKINEIPYTIVSSIMYDEERNTYWIGTQDEGLYSLKLDESNAPTVTKILTESALKRTTVLHIFQDAQQHLWLSTQGEGVYKLTITGENEVAELINYNEENGLGALFVREVFEDIEGNIWIGTYGNGLAALFDEAFVFYRYEEVLGSNIYSVTTYEEGFWMGGNGQIMKIALNSLDGNETYGHSNGIPDDRISTMYYDEQNTLWFGTAENGLYKMDLNSKMATKYHTSENSLENNVNAITSDEDMLWVATNNGVISIDVATGNRVTYNTNDGLPHNKINDIFSDSKGNIWIATRSNGLHSVNTDSVIKIEGNVVLEFVSVTEDDYGNLWAATDNQGVFKFSDTLSYYSMDHGLKSNACYSIVNDGKGNIWVCHRLGLSKINVAENWIATYGPESGINGDCHFNAVNVTSDGEVLFGTSDGLVTFDTDKERTNVTAPFVNITSVRIGEREYDISEPIVLPYGIYKMRIEFVGLNFMAPERVTYQYRLEGYDDWSDPTTLPYIQYSRVEDGEYTFQLIACNSEGVCSEVPVEFSLRVKLPIWKTWWFITILVFVLIFSVYLIIKFRERKAKQFQEMLQKRLDERTREVVMQKEEIEVKNKDITDSINYAQRIQASILPPISKLVDTFAGSFVFYQPRDIVSGDFYWYDRFEDRFIIVCADSTGHGVPGAFMSMIGTTLLKDICRRSQINSPAKLLNTLDKEIMSALNQNIEAERSNDGMDIIVAEVNLKSNVLNIASAMRPMIIYHKGEQVYVRGSRSSVGGQYESTEKMFEPQEFQLDPGDRFYMFSDGYPDQFGGPLGKKFKMVRMKNMLRDIHDKPMDEQYAYIKNNFELWKEDLEQVDDVLCMGIEV